MPQPCQSWPIAHSFVLLKQKLWLLQWLLWQKPPQQLKQLHGAVHSGL
jgi:hypothetical protein